MKKPLSLSILFVFFATNIFSQYYITEKITTTIIQERSIYLNGGLRASAGGKSRISIPIDLPENTVEWYYSFSTSPGESGTKNLNLALQLSSFLVDYTGTTSQLMTKVKVPIGSNSIDIYLLSQENENVTLGMFT
jgi:hypothetical protein